jgi:uncharacterized protein (TIGR04222 family)
VLRADDGQRVGLPSPAEIALVEGGPSRAVYASLASLRAVGAVGLDQQRHLTVTGPALEEMRRLDQAVYDAAGRGLRVADLQADLRVASSLDELRSSVDRSGWLLDASRRAKARSGGLLLLVVAFVGGVRTVAGILNGKPVLYLVTLSVLTLIAGLVLCRVPRHTAAYVRALAEVRRRSAHLAPTQYPAWSTYGFTGAAMGVALFGTTAIWAADPAFAAGADLARRPLGDAGGANAGGSGCGGGGGGGDGGGGGCGGGCGG